MPTIREEEYNALKDLCDVMEKHNITFKNSDYGLEFYVNNKKVINPLDDYIQSSDNLREALNKNYDDIATKKYYFFRDTTHEENLDLNGRTYHAAGYVESFRSEIDNPCPSLKDVLVVFIHPFDGMVISAWRSFDEIELFEVNDIVYNDLFNHIEKIDKLWDDEL